MNKPITVIHALALTLALTMVSGPGLAADAEADAKQAGKHIENRFK